MALTITEKQYLPNPATERGKNAVASLKGTHTTTTDELLVSFDMAALGGVGACFAIRKVANSANYTATLKVSMDALTWVAVTAKDQADADKSGSAVVISDDDAWNYFIVHHTSFPAQMQFRYIALFGKTASGTAAIVVSACVK